MLDTPRDKNARPVRRGDKTQADEDFLPLSISAVK